MGVRLREKQNIFNNHLCGTNNFFYKAVDKQVEPVFDFFVWCDLCIKRCLRDKVSLSINV